MTDSGDLTHAVLLRVADFLRRLPPGQLGDLATGTAKLTVVPAGGRSPARRPAAVSLPVAPERVRAELAAIGDRAAAARYLNDLKLTVPKLRALAQALDIAVPGKATKDVLSRTIVEWTVGRRLDSEAISRPGT